MNNIKSIGIIGYGRFGQLLHAIFQNTLKDIEIKISSRSNQIDGKMFFNFEEAVKCDLVIPVVPIKYFESTIVRIAKLIPSGSTIMDVCSVKLHPEEVMLKNIPEGINIIATHPMFGPGNLKKLGIDPYKLDLEKKFKGLKIVISNVRCDEQNYELIKKYFSNLNMTVVEMSCEEHDKKTAETQFVSLYIAQILQNMDIKENEIMTPSADKMIFYKEMITVDESLVRDIYNFNPFAKDQINKIDREFQKFRKYITN